MCVVELFFPSSSMCEVYIAARCDQIGFLVFEKNKNKILRV